MHIRRAENSEHALLTEISYASKQVWGYSAEIFEIFKKELTITEEYIGQNVVFVAEMDGKVIGYFSIAEVTADFYAGRVKVEKGFWLEHLFIHPQYIQKGIGSKLIGFAKAYCREKGIPRLRLFSDPHANGFYEKTGAVYQGESPSSIENRTVSVFEYIL